MDTVVIDPIALDIAAFFQQSAGRWSSIKSNHHATTTQQQSGRATLTIALLPTTAPTVAQLCTTQAIDITQVACAVEVKWDGSMEGEPKNDVGSSLLVAVGTAIQGKLYRTIDGNPIGNNPIAQVTPGEYRFGEGGELILTIVDGPSTATERIWLESENVRMRHTKVQQADGQSIISFCSEVRILSAAPANA
jgi:CpeS-like protein